MRLLALRRPRSLVVEMDEDEDREGAAGSGAERGRCRRRGAQLIVE